MAEAAESMNNEDSEGIDKNNHMNTSKGVTDVKVTIDNSSHNESGIEKDILVDDAKLIIKLSTTEERSEEDMDSDVHDVSGNNHLGLGFLKKDDSGIDLGRSPTNGKDSSTLSDLDISESLTDSGAGSRTNSVSEASNKDSQDKLINDTSAEKVSRAEEKDKDSSTVMPESIDTEDSDPVGSYNVSMQLSDSDIEDDDDDDDDDKTDSVDDETKRKRMSKARRVKDSVRKQLRTKKHRSLPLDSDDTDSENDDIHTKQKSGQGDSEGQGQIDVLDSDDNESSDSSSSSDEDDGDEDQKPDVKEKKDSSGSDSDEGDQSERAKPKQIWNALFDCRKREYGYSNKTPPAIFREKVQGSLQMVQRFKLQYKMDYHEGCVNALHFNRIGTLLASGSDDLNVVLWNWIRNRPALVYDSGHRSNVFQAKFMPFSGDCHVVSCARDGQIRLAELSLTGVCKGTKKLAQHRGAAHKLALELDSPHLLLSCGEDAVVYEVDLREDSPNKLVLTKEGEKKVPLYSIHSNPLNSFEFCVGGRDQYIRVYDKRKIDLNENNGLLKKFCPHHLVNSDVKANVTCAVYNYNGTEILGSYNDEDIYLFNNLHSDGAEYIHRYRGHRNNATVKGINFYGPKSEFIVSGSDCGHVFLWDRETEDIVQFMEGDDGGVINVLEPHPFAPVLATSGLDHDVKIWAPTAEAPTELKDLKKTAKKNRKEREEERSNEPDMIDEQMLWYIVHHIRRARRRAQQDGAAQAAREDNSSSSDGSDFDSEDSEEMPERMSCAPS